MKPIIDIYNAYHAVAFLYLYIIIINTPNPSFLTFVYWI